MTILGNALSFPISSSNDEPDTPTATSSTNYFDILTQFFQKHNPSKASDAKKLLEKFKVRISLVPSSLFIR
jgi:hypothetical protein